MGVPGKYQMSLHCIMRTLFTLNYAYPSPPSRQMLHPQSEKETVFKWNLTAKSPRAGFRQSQQWRSSQHCTVQSSGCYFFSAATIPIYPSPANILIQAGCLALLPPCAGMLVGKSWPPFSPLSPLCESIFQPKAWMLSPARCSGWCSS